MRGGCWKPSASHQVLLPSALCPWPAPPAQAATEEVGADKPVKIANFLCPGNYAVSGSKEGCDVVVNRGKEFKARCAELRQGVSGSLHAVPCRAVPCPVSFVIPRVRLPVSQSVWA